MEVESITKTLKVLVCLEDAAFDLITVILVVMFIKH